MNEKNKQYYPSFKKDIPFSLFICFYSTLYEPLENKDIMEKLLYNLLNNKLDCLNALLEHPEFTKFLYFNKKSVHQILYDKEEMINLDFHNEFTNLSYYFYIDLLISDNLDLVNYTYSLDYIKAINKLKNNYKDSQLKQVLLSNIIIKLIYNYKGFSTQNNDDDLISIEEENNNYIKNNIGNISERFKNNKLNKINTIDIYKEILISLIENNTFNDYKSIYNIINQLDLESISITHSMVDELSQHLKVDSNIASRYMISKPEDCLDDKKINFYFILLKYILKYSYYIYTISFLYKSRKNIIKIIKSKINNISFDLFNEDEQEKFDYIIMKITDSEYYYKKYLNYKITEILKYYKEFLFDSKKENINKIEDIIKNKNSNKKEYEEYLQDFNKAEKIIKRAPVIKYMIECKNKEKNEQYLNEYIKEWDNIETLINRNELESIGEEDKLILIKYFNDEKNKEILIKIFNKDIYNELIQENSFSYKIYSNITSREITNNKDKSISCLSNENENSSKISYKIILEEFNKSLLKKPSKELKASKYELLHFIKKTEKQNFSIEYIQELENDYLIFGGTSNNLYIYSHCINELKLGINDYINSFYVENFDKNILNIVTCSKKGLHLIKINLEDKNSSSQFDIKSKALTKYIPLSSEKKEFLLIGEKGVYISHYYPFDKIITKGNSNISSDSYKNGIKINDDLYALTSNEITPNGKNILNIYSIDEKKSKYINKEYSFILSINGLLCMPPEENNIKKNQNKVLLCACKKYRNNKKNGILLVNISDKDIKENFYDTETFEVYCFCPIKYELNQNNKNKDDKIYDYFFVGGYDIKRKKGAIKLYIIKYKLKNNESTIKYIMDIRFENNSLIKISKPISCIIQLKRRNNIVLTSWDGSIYFFTPPNMNFFLDEKKNLRKLKKDIDNYNKKIKNYN